MKSNVAKICSAVLCVSIIMSLFCILGSGENIFKDSGEKLTYISNYGGNIDKGLLSTTVTAYIEGKTSVTSVKIKMELQKLSGGDYSTVKTWEQTFSGRNGFMEESKLTNPFSTYRLKATFTAYSGSNSETKTLYVNAS